MKRIPIRSADQQCQYVNSGKHVFESRGAALGARRLLSSSKVKAYWCETHHGWHLGRNPERRT